MSIQFLYYYRSKEMGEKKRLQLYFMKYVQIHISKLECHSSAGRSKSKHHPTETGKAKYEL